MTNPNDLKSTSLTPQEIEQVFLLLKLARSQEREPFRAMLQPPSAGPEITIHISGTTSPLNSQQGKPNAKLEQPGK
jgi:hypothetical protein